MAVLHALEHAEHAPGQGRGRGRVRVRIRVRVRHAREHVSSVGVDANEEGLRVTDLVGVRHVLRGGDG